MAHTPGKQRDTKPDVLTERGCARLLSRRCSTCITYPDDRMHLGERRQAFIDETIAKDSYVICHDTGRAATASEAAICRGFWDLHRHQSSFCALYQGLELVEEVEPPVRGYLGDGDARRDRADSAD